MPEKVTPRPPAHDAVDPEVKSVARQGFAACIRNPALIAVAVLLVIGPPAFWAPRLSGHPGGGDFSSLGLPLAAGLGGATVLLLIVTRLSATRWLAGVAAGLYASWIILMLSNIMRGTPFPFYGLVGDSGRLTAMATRYTTTAASTDAIMPGLPSEYPPLFPWLVGRTSVLLDIPAWQLVGSFEIIFTGVAVVVGFALWQRLLSPWLGLSVTVACFMTFPVPMKAYELIALMIFLPWTILTFSRPPIGRLHWLASGLAAGFLVTTYYGWLVFGGLGLAAMAWLTWRSEPDRKAFLRYLAKAAAVAFVASSWFTIPLIYAKLTMGGPTVADLYGSSNMLDQLFPFMQFTTPGVAGVLALLQLVGLVGLVCLYHRAWWAKPLALLVIGAYFYRGLGGVFFVLTQHTALSQYTASVYASAFSAAGVLTVSYVVPVLFKRVVRGGVPAYATAMGVAIMLAWSGYSFGVDWTPGAPGRYTGITSLAYDEPYPDGSYVRDSATHTPWFPVTPIQQAVEEVLGPDVKAVCISTDERLFSFLPWPGYIGNDLWSSISRVLERLAEVQRLAAVTDPAAFTAESQHLKYGRIDVFVLHEMPAGWQWTFHQGFGQPEAVVTFQRSQFDPTSWVIRDDLPQDVVVVVRKP